MKKKQQLELTEEDKEFVKDLSRKLVLKAYLDKSASRPRTLLAKLKSMFVKEPYRAPIVDIFKAIESNRK